MIHNGLSELRREDTALFTVSKVYLFVESVLRGGRGSRAAYKFFNGCMQNMTVASCSAMLLMCHKTTTVTDCVTVHGTVL